MLNSELNALRSNTDSKKSSNSSSGHGSNNSTSENNDEDDDECTNEGAPRHNDYDAMNCSLSSHSSDDNNVSTSMDSKSSPTVNNLNSEQRQQQQQQQQAKRSKSTFPFGKCKVCNDKATGVHYGVATCEGCKVSSACNSFAFFFVFVFFVCE
jgi:hypothetical protein